MNTKKCGDSSIIELSPLKCLEWFNNNSPMLFVYLVIADLLKRERWFRHLPE